MEIQSRAVSDAGSLEEPCSGPSDCVKVTMVRRSCTAEAPCGFWSTDPTPAVWSQIKGKNNTPLDVEFGLRFQTQAEGFITDLRFYKAWGIASAQAVQGYLDDATDSGHPLLPLAG